MIIEEIEKEEEALRVDLYSADRKFAEYYNVGELGNSYEIDTLCFIRYFPHLTNKIVFFLPEVFRE